MTTEREPEVEIYVRADSADVLREVSDERTRHVEVEGWTEAHDDKHDKGELAGAAGVYAVNAAGILAGAAWLRFFNAVWPWSKQWWKPKTRRYDLIRAASLIVAECERIDRCALKGDGKS